MRVVIDTNVALDLWVFEDASVDMLRAALDSGAITPLRSDAVDAEFAEVLARPQFCVAAQRRQGLMARWQTRALRVDPVTASALRCRDGDDQKFLDLAAAGNAAWLLTKDKALLRLARQARASGLRIAAPRALRNAQDNLFA